jgi:Xaa-Pro aminopeptidase
MANSETQTILSQAQRLPTLRALLAREGLSGFVVPHADEHQSEYLPPAAERLAWLTGFDGSAGMAIVLASKAAIFVDGRYTTQAARQVDASAFEPQHLMENPPSKWLAANLNGGERIGYDPWLMTVAEVKRFGEVCAAAGASFVPVVANPIDALWADRPPAPPAPVTLQPVAFAGEEAAAKIARLQADLADKGVDAAIITQADSVAWLFNIRGGDVAHNPVPLSFAILPATGKPELFIDARKLSNSVRATLSEIVEPRAPGELAPALAALGSRKAKVLLDQNSAADAIAGAIRDAGGTIVAGSDPVVLPRARKNATEIDGTRRAHIRDGAAMVRFLAWLDGAADGGALDEISVAEKLGRLRAETATRDGSELVDLSFATISGAGPNGAIIHYRVTPETNRQLAAGELYLVDSGAQYRDGTTDITRTIAIGTPIQEMRDRFTRVLKGHIAIATARWRARRSGRRGWTTTTARGTASALFFRCMKGRRASPNLAALRSSRG